MPEAIDFELDSSRYITMHNGRKFYMSDPTFNMKEINYHLANLFRWNGSSSKHITVAEHSVRCSYETDGDPLEALLHDVTEAWLGDVPGPWKAFLPDFVKLETYLWEAFVDWFDEQYPNCAGRLGKQMSDATKHADWRCLYIEAREVIPGQGKGWVMEDKFGATELDMPCHFWDVDEAYDRFYNRFHELTW